mgnify:CR=1 FL=1|tara:strand:- start:375 stop:620 length:246 start_codon:yes stop_codon:yes gene_type:complete
MKKTPTSMNDLKKMMAMDPEDLIPMPTASGGRPTKRKKLGSGQGGTVILHKPGKPQGQCPKKKAKAKAERKRKKKHRRKNR